MKLTNRDIIFILFNWIKRTNLDTMHRKLGVSCKILSIQLLIYAWYSFKSIKFLIYA